MNSVISATPSSSKAKTIAYWLITGLLVFELANGALWDFNVLNQSYAYGVLAHLGYPAYLATLLGVSKLLAAATFLVPRFPLLKEWAYAGSTVLFGGALISHATVGDGFDKLVWPLAFLALVLASWALRPANRRLRSNVAAIA